MTQSFSDAWAANVKGQTIEDLFWVQPNTSNKHIGGNQIKLSNGFSIITNGGDRSSESYTEIYILNPQGEVIAEDETQVY
jgi:hypothetical protein